MKLSSRTAVALAAAAALLALAGCSSAGTANTTGTGGTTKGGTLTIAAAVDVKSFDPAQAHIGHYLQYDQPVYDSLLRRKADGTLVPMLATKWKYNDDDTVLTLTLRKDVEFSDGTKLDARAVKTNLDRFRSGNGPDASTLAQVSEVAATDATTVVITLKAPDPSLLDYLGNADGFIASPKAIDAGNIATKPIGSGPYTLDTSKTVAGSSYTFVKRAGYWDPSLQVYDTIVIKPILDSTATLNALISGQVDAALLTAKTEPQAKNAGFTEYKYGTDWQGLLIFDRDGKTVPALADERVRQAINYAVDKKTLLTQVGKGLGTVTNQVFGPTTSAYDKSLDDTYPYDPEKAKSLLAEAGYSNGFTVTMPTVSGLIDPALQAAIGQNLGDVGITVKWDNVAAADFIADITQGKYPMTWFSLFQGSPWVASNQILTPNATYNPFHTTDPKVEELIAKVQSGSDADQAAAAKDLNEYVTEQAWFAPFYRPDQIFFTDKTTVTKPQNQQAVPSIYSYAPKG
ncbi:peptide/nickel transport system substrate-binding protein [Curtobacterium pusillum]|uniref:Peptide/nickel transport system substrate-binding protein n=1 Tax=Curtobacterium pusillum TaxID=69373 RepID=A0AAW3T1F2_9MICO|nr:ABC transporter substrate-binding protein [Curtobacterium pusillum]MBA8989038.1 peptide/nickel transport system substrate-binding protein [Curtobacterium pusillum]